MFFCCVFSIVFSSMFSVLFVFCVTFFLSPPNKAYISISIYIYISKREVPIFCGEEGTTLCSGEGLHR